MRFWKNKKQTLSGIFLFFGIPIIIYYLIDWNLVITKDRYGEPVSIGLPIFFGLYWIMLVLIFKYRAEIKDYKTTIKKLLYGTMDDNEKSLIKKRLELEK